MSFCSYSVHRVQNLRGNSFDGGGDFKAEDFGFMVIDIEKLARMNGVDDFSSVRKLNTATGAISTARPAGVNEPAGGSVFLHLFSEHSSVLCGM